MKLTALLSIVVLLVVVFSSTALSQVVREISCGETKSDEIAAPGEVDPWTFTASEGDHVVIDVRRTSASTLLPHLALYDPDGELVTHADWHIRTELSQIGTYEIRVYDRSLEDTGDYNLSLVNLSCPGTPISCGDLLSGSISAVAETDLYEFAGQAGDHVVIDARRTSGSTLRPALALHGPGGELVTYADWHIRTELIQSGTYKVRVYDGDSGSGDMSLEDTGDYNLSLVNLVNPSCPGTPISCGDLLSGSISAVADIDVYEFAGQAGDHVVIDARRTSGSTLRPALALDGPDGLVTQADLHIRTKLNKSGRYTIRVYDMSLEDTGDYNLSLVNLSCPGTPISCGDLLSRSISTVADIDVYEFAGQAGDHVVIDVRRTSGSTLRPALALHGPGGELVTYADWHMRTELIQSGTYKVRVYDGDSGSGDMSLEDTGDYNLSLVNLSCPGTPISCGDLLSGSISTVADIDVYEFAGHEGDQVVIDVRRTSGSTLRPALALHGPDGELVTYADWHIRTEVSQSGTYKIRVYDGDSGSGDMSLEDTGDYEITFSSSGCKPDLTFKSLSVAPNPVMQLNQFQVNWTIENQGNADATPVGYLVDIRLSSDTIYDDTDTLICSTQINDTLSSGQEISGSCLGSSADYLAGTYYIVAKVDTTDVVDESSETNNTASLAFEITPPAQCALHVHPGPGGSTDPEGTVPGDCGEIVPLVATPDPHYDFVNWTGPVADSTSPITTVTVNEDTTVIANFAIDQHNLTTDSSEGGSVTTPGEETKPYDHGQIVPLVATPDPHYDFVNWTGPVADSSVIPASLQNLKKVCGGVFLGGAAGLTAQPISGV